MQRRILLAAMLATMLILLAGCSVDDLNGIQPKDGACVEYFHSTQRNSDVFVYHDSCQALIPVGNVGIVPQSAMVIGGGKNA